MDNVENEMFELEQICQPIIDFLKNKHPYCSITVDSESIKLNETIIGVPVLENKPICRKDD